MAKPNDITQVRQFVDLLYGRMKGVTDPKEAIEFCIAHGLIHRRLLRNYLIINSFHEGLKRGEQATQLFFDLGEDFGLHERQVQNIVYKSIKNKVFQEVYNVAS